MASPVMQFARLSLVNTNICRVAGNLINAKQGDQQVYGFATLKHGSATTLPVPPKRPPTGFILFANDARPNVVKQNPSLKPTEVIRAIAARWRSADESTKQKYTALSKLRREEFIKQKELYDTKLTVQQKEALKEVAIEKKLKSTKKKLHETLRQLERPKGPRSAYVLFTTAKRSDIRAKLPKKVTGSKFASWLLGQPHVESTATQAPQEVMTTLAQMWKELPEEKKKPYHEKAEVDRARYEAEMVTWMKRMDKEGKWEMLNDLKEDIRELRKEHDPLKKSSSKS
ncbi:transcription factor A, mitochondrial-like isoform X1 [Ornithodoros turicata]|uniref:transcription factor A, mitochondrial-like isoform X1 n=1 Tax=Ornithodoros turicata TaxID=34597 RepID=UPI003138A2E2